MLTDMIDLFAEPQSYVCIWQNGELYIRLASEVSVEGPQQAAEL